MKTDDPLSPAALQYAEAHALHYAERDLLGALRSYSRVIASSPDTPEAGYSRTQILGIVKQVVPAGELLAAQTELAVHCLQPGSGDTETADRP